MEVDRQIDKDIHTMMGLCSICQLDFKRRTHAQECIPFQSVPAYSTSISDAFKVVEWLRAKGYAFLVTALDYADGTQSWSVCVGKTNKLNDHGKYKFCSEGSKLPLAICQCALKLKDTE